MDFVLKIILLNNKLHYMIRTQFTCITGSLIAGLSLYGLEVEVQKFDNIGNVPLGYQNVADGIDAAEVIDVSTDPFVDYAIPNNAGSAGLTAAKSSGAFIAETTVSAMGGNMGGANKLIDPDRYQVVFRWEDGNPLPFGQDYYGVSWANFGSGSTATLSTRINLASPEEVTVYHWFNDGWNYADGGHETLTGHKLTVTHYNSSDSLIAEKSVVLSSGGAENIFGDHRQFYTAIIKAERTDEGDYLVIENTGGNIGYKGTAVALLDAGLKTGPEEFSGYEIVDGWVDSDAFLGWVFVEHYPWILPLALNKYIYSGGSGWYYIAK